MGRTILCPHCQSALNEDILKQRNSENVCLVCGGSLLGDMDIETPTHDEIEKIDLEHPDMYFYSIDSEDKYEDKSWRRIWCQCTSCRYANSILYSNFSIIKSEYVKLKDGIEIHCKGCGKVVANSVIPKRPDGWRELNMWKKDYDNLLKCPICHSTKIHKISMTNKAAFALTFGVFAVGHVSKTYKCDVCGSKW